MITEYTILLLIKKRYSLTDDHKKVLYKLARKDIQHLLFLTDSTILFVKKRGRFIDIAIGTKKHHEVVKFPIIGNLWYSLFVTLLGTYRFDMLAKLAPVSALPSKQLKQ